MALEGRVDDAIAKFKKSEDLLGLGLLVFALTMLGALLMLFFEGPRAFSFIVILGLIVCVPIVLTGLIKVDRVDDSLIKKKTANKFDLASKQTTRYLHDQQIHLRSSLS